MNSLQCVDVVIPVFNGHETIQSALASVLAQEGNYVNKIIVVDDGSTDETSQIVQNLASPMIELVRTSNQGVAIARNLGIEQSKALWIAFLDADDVWRAGKLQAQLAAAQEHGAGFVCGSVSEWSVRGNGLISAKILANGNFVATSSVLVKRSVLQQISPVFIPKMTFAEDYLAWLKCLTLTPGYYLSTQLVDYILSIHPRYRWGQIFRNMLSLNFLYANFLRQIGSSSTQRLILSVAVFLGSLRSILSIMKRFIRSYSTEKNNQ
jgi:glycosyltransferase involved in cell wall biosynthesis